MKVYISGPIYIPGSVPNAREHTDAWRNEATILLESYGIEVLDPCRRKAIYDPKLFTPNEIVFRDLKDVDDSQLILMNFHLVGDKLPIGTVMEAMFAWMQKKPVVVVSDDPRIVGHPWIQAMVVRIFKSIPEACCYINQFWNEETK